MLSVRCGKWWDISVVISSFMFYFFWLYEYSVIILRLSVYLVAIIRVLLKFQRTHWTLLWWNSACGPKRGASGIFRKQNWKKGEQGSQAAKSTSWHHGKPTWGVAQKSSAVWVEELALLSHHGAALPAPEVLPSCCASVAWRSRI